MTYKLDQRGSEGGAPSSLTTHVVCIDYGKAIGKIANGGMIQKIKMH